MRRAAHWASAPAVSRISRPRSSTAFSKNAEHEFVASVGLNIEGAASRGAGCRRRTLHRYTPTFYFGKGFGDHAGKHGLGRPFAVTGQVGYAIPSSNATMTDGDIEFNRAGVLVWALRCKYSLPYLKASVVDLGLPDSSTGWIPLVEVSLRRRSQYGQFRHRDHRHHQYRADLCRRHLSATRSRR